MLRIVKDYLQTRSVGRLARGTRRPVPPHRAWDVHLQVRSLERRHVFDASFALQDGLLSLQHLGGSPSLTLADTDATGIEQYLFTLDQGTWQGADTAGVQVQANRLAVAKSLVTQAIHLQSGPPAVQSLDVIFQSVHITAPQLTIDQAGMVSQLAGSTVSLQKLDVTADTLSLPSLTNQLSQVTAIVDQRIELGDQDNLVLGNTRGSNLHVQVGGSVTLAQAARIEISQFAQFIAGQQIALGDPRAPNATPVTATDRVQLGAFQFTAGGNVTLAVDGTARLVGNNRANQLQLQVTGSIVGDSPATAIEAQSAQLEIVMPTTSLGGDRPRIDLMGPNRISNLRLDILADAQIVTPSLGDVRIHNVAEQATLDQLLATPARRVEVEDLVLWFEHSTLQLPASQLHVLGDALLMAGLTRRTPAPAGTDPLPLKSAAERGLFVTSMAGFFDEQLVGSRLVTRLTSLEDEAGVRWQIAGNLAALSRDFIVLADNPFNQDQLHVAQNALFASRDSGIRIGLPDVGPNDPLLSVRRGDVELGTVTLVGPTHGEVYTDQDVVLTGQNRLRRLEMQSSGSITDDMSPQPGQPANAATSLTISESARFTAETIHIGRLGVDRTSFPAGNANRGRVEFGTLQFDAQQSALIAEDDTMILSGPSRGTIVELESVGSMREQMGLNGTRAWLTADTAHLHVLSSPSLGNVDIDLMGRNSIRDARVSLHAIDQRPAILDDLLFRNVHVDADLESLQGVLSQLDATRPLEDVVLWLDQASVNLPATTWTISGDALWIAGWEDRSPLPMFNQALAGGDRGLFADATWLQPPETYLRKVSTTADITDAPGTQSRIAGQAQAIAARHITLADQPNDLLHVDHLASWIACDGSIHVGVPQSTFAQLPGTISPHSLGGDYVSGSVSFQSLREFSATGERNVVALAEDSILVLAEHNRAAGDLWLASTTGIADLPQTTTSFSAHAHLAVIDARGQRGNIVLGNGTAVLRAEHAGNFLPQEGYLSLFAESAALATQGTLHVGSSAAHPFNLAHELVLQQIDGGIYQVIGSSVIVAPHVALETWRSGGGPPGVGQAGSSIGAVVLWNMSTRDLSAVANGSIRQADLPTLPRTVDRYARTGDVLDGLPTRNTAEGRANRPFQGTLLDMQLPADNPYAVIFVNNATGVTNSELAITNHTFHVIDPHARGLSDVTVQGVGISTMSGHVYLEHAGPIRLIDEARQASPSQPITLVSVGTDAHGYHAGQLPANYLFTANAIRDVVTIGEYRDAQGKTAQLPAGSILLKSSTGTVSSVKHANGTKFDVGPLIRVTPRSRTAPTFGAPEAGPATSEFVLPDGNAPAAWRELFLQNFEIQVGSPGEEHFVLAFIWHDSQVDLNQQLRFTDAQPLAFAPFPEILEIVATGRTPLIQSPAGARVVTASIPSYQLHTSAGQSTFLVRGDRQGGPVQINAQHMFDALFIQTNPLPTLVPTSVVVYNDPLINLLQTPVGGEAETNSVLSDLNEARVGFNLNEILSDDSQSEPGFVLAFTVNLKVAAELPRDPERPLVLLPPPSVFVVSSSTTALTPQTLSGTRHILADEIGLVEYGLVDAETEPGQLPRWKKKWVFNGPRDGDGVFVEQIEQSIRNGHLDEYPLGQYEIWIHYQHNPVPQKARYLEKSPEWDSSSLIGPASPAAEPEATLPPGTEVVPGGEPESGDAAAEPKSTTSVLEGAWHWRARVLRQISQAQISQAQLSEVQIAESMANPPRFRAPGTSS